MDHTMSSNESNFIPDPWIEKYIFQNSLIPSMDQLINTMEPYFVLQYLHNFGLDNDKVLMAWLQKFQKGFAWAEVKL